MMQHYESRVLFQGTAMSNETRSHDANPSEEADALVTFRMHVYSPSLYSISSDYWNIQKANTFEEQESRVSNVDRDLCTRNVGIAGLVFGSGLSIACIVVGLHMILSGRPPLPPWLFNMIESVGVLDYYWIVSRRYLSGHQVVRFPRVVAIMIPLVINVVVTLILDAANTLHSTTLRWALWEEGRLEYNTNLRLFTSAKHRAANSWPVNFVSALSLVFAYGCSSLFTYDVYIKGSADADGNMISSNVDGLRNALDFNGWAIFGLGLFVLLQVIISLWSLLGGRDLVQSWGCNPVNNTKACIAAGIVQNYAEDNPVATSEGHHGISTLRCYQASSRILAIPRRSQHSPRTLIRAVRHVGTFVWALFGITAIWVMVLAGIGIRTSSTNLQYVLENSDRTDSAAFWEYFGQVTINYSTEARRDWLGIIIQTAFQSCITIGLHCVELLVCVHRDEEIWRKTAKQNGLLVSESSIWNKLKNWPTVTLFAFKSVTHSVFSNAFSANAYIRMNLLPVVALAVLMLLLAFFTEYLAQAKSTGPHPATFGNLQAIVDLVDDWDCETMWWGDKGKSGGVRRAGTAGHLLPEVYMDEMYVGVRTKFDSVASRRSCC